MALYRNWSHYGASCGVNDSVEGGPRLNTISTPDSEDGIDGKVRKPIPFQALVACKLAPEMIGQGNCMGKPNIAKLCPHVKPSTTRMTTEGIGEAEPTIDY